MKTKKLIGYKATMSSFDGHKGPETIKSILESIPTDLKKRLTGLELGMVMSAVNNSFHKGRSSMGGLDLFEDCIWLPFGGEENKGQLIPIEALRQIKITDSSDKKVYSLEWTESF